MDRRALVFVIFSVVCFALYPLADHYDGADGWSFGGEGWSFVPVVLGVVYALLALASYLDHRTRRSLGVRSLGDGRGATGDQPADAGGPRTGDGEAG